MKIALVSTCSAMTPPRAYGGIELFVATLARELLRAGQHVTVYATGDSRPPGELRFEFATSTWPPDFRRERQHARHAWLDSAARGADIVHLNMPDAVLESSGAVPSLVTVHHAHDARLAAMYSAHPEVLKVAISRDQARWLPAPRARVIYHGLDPVDYPPGPGAGRYVAFLGRIGPDKAPHLAIDAARLARVPLRIGGPHWGGHNPCYDAYFADEMLPRLRAASDEVQWLGELDHFHKLGLLQRAEALLMPLGWDEPFGLVMIEAMLVGTPVIAMRRGSAPEVVEDGISGLLVSDPGEMASAIGLARRLDRRTCRERALARFGAATMAEQYLDCYRALLEQRAEVAASGQGRNQRRPRGSLSKKAPVR